MVWRGAELRRECTRVTSRHLDPSECSEPVQVFNLRRVSEGSETTHPGEHPFSKCVLCSQFEKGPWISVSCLSTPLLARWFTSTSSPALPEKQWHENIRRADLSLQRCRRTGLWPRVRSPLVPTESFFGMFLPCRRAFPWDDFGFFGAYLMIQQKKKNRCAFLLFFWLIVIPVPHPHNRPHHVAASILNCIRNQP